MLEGCGCEEKKREPRRLTRGDTLYFVVTIVENTTTNEIRTVRSGEPFPPGFAPKNLTGVRVWFTAKEYVQLWDNQAVSQLDNQTLGGVVVLSATGGQISVTMPAQTTLGFADGVTELPYDIQIEDASNRVTTVEKDLILVTPDVTRAI